MWWERDKYNVSYLHVATGTVVLCSLMALRVLAFTCLAIDSKILGLGHYCGTLNSDVLPGIILFGRSVELKSAFAPVQKRPVDASTKRLAELFSHYLFCT